MPSGKAIKAGEAFLELTVKDDKFAAGLQKSLSSLQKTGKSIALIGAGISALGASLTAPFAASVKIFAGVGDALDEMSQRTGVSVESLSQLEYAADQSGASIEDVETSLKKMSKLLVSAKEGSKEAGQTFHELGLAFDEIENKNPAEQMGLFLSALSRITDASTRSGLAMKVFGKSGTALLPMAASFRDLIEEAEHFNLTVSKDAAARGGKLRDTFSLLVAVFKRLGFEIGDALSGKLTAGIRAVAEIAAQSISWAKANHDVVISLALTAAGVLGVGSAITGFGVSLSISRIALGGIVGLLGTLLSPLGLTAAALTAAGIAFVKFTSIGQSAATYLAGVFGQLSEAVRQTFSAMADALSGGDILAAAGVLWAGLKLIWAKGTDDLSRVWIELKDSILRVTVDMIFQVEKLWSDFWLFLKTGWALAAEAAANYADTIGKLLSKATGEYQEEDTGASERAAKRARESESTITGDQAQHDRDVAKLNADKAAALEDRTRGRESELGKLKRELEDRQREFDAARKLAGAGAIGFKDGKLADFLGASVGSLGDFASTIGARSTFSGKLAPQIFGAGGVDATLQKSLETQQRSEKHLEAIRQKAFDRSGAQAKLRAGNV